MKEALLAIYERIEMNTVEIAALKESLRSSPPDQEWKSRMHAARRRVHLDATGSLERLRYLLAQLPE
jgi:hypothetical protein